jgi:hypothetical protein
VFESCRLTILLWVRTLWRCSDSLFFKVPPLASDALLITFHPLLKNVLQAIDHFKICLEALFSWLEKARNCMGQDLDCMTDVLMGFHRSTFSKLNTELNSDLTPCDFWVFTISNTKGKHIFHYWLSPEVFDTPSYVLMMTMIMKCWWYALQTTISLPKIHLEMRTVKRGAELLMVSVKLTAT